MVHAIVLNMHPDHIERRAMADPMTFDEGERRLAMVRQRKEAWDEQMRAVIEKPEFRRHSTWVSSPLWSIYGVFRRLIVRRWMRVGLKRTWCGTSAMS